MERNFKALFEAMEENKKMRDFIIAILEKCCEITEKLEKLGQNSKAHFEGMLYSKPMNYWDYIQTDVLLNLQSQRSTLPDEMVFIMYHQINELLFKMILWEIEQISLKKI